MACAWRKKSHRRASGTEICVEISPLRAGRTRTSTGTGGDEVGLDPSEALDGVNKALVVADAAMGAEGDRNFSEKLEAHVSGDSMWRNLSANTDPALRSHGSLPAFAISKFPACVAKCG